MAGRLSVDTSFLIDVQRERSAGVPGPAHAALERDPDVELYLCPVALGEFAEGFADPEHPVLRAARELHVPLPLDEEAGLTYGRLASALRAEGRMIGSNDLWIAATAMRYGLPLITGNTADFGRVPRLEVVAYR